MYWSLELLLQYIMYFIIPELLIYNLIYYYFFIQCNQNDFLISYYQDLF